MGYEGPGRQPALGLTICYLTRQGTPQTSVDSSSSVSLTDSKDGDDVDTTIPVQPKITVPKVVIACRTQDDSGAVSNIHGKEDAS